MLIVLIEAIEVGVLAHTLASRTMRQPSLQAIAGWLCTSVPLGILLYFAVSQTLRRRETARFHQLESPA
jgi:hypothetical protein